MSEVILTKEEAECLYDFLEIHLIDDIRDDLDIDNMTWLAHIMNIWQKCREVYKENGHNRVTAMANNMGVTDDDNE